MWGIQIISFYLIFSSRSSNIDFPLLLGSFREEFYTEQQSKGLNFTFKWAPAYKVGKERDVLECASSLVRSSSRLHSRA